jgi:hypothetical protein
MGFWHRFGTGSGSRARTDLHRATDPQARRFDFVLSARRDAAAAIFQKAFEVRGPGFPLRIAAMAQRCIPSSYGYTMN